MATSEIDDETLERITEEDDLLRLARIGLDMQEFQQSPGGKHLIRLARADLNASLEALLEEPDPGSAVARESHANARAALLAIRYIERTIEEGREAHKRILEEDENAEGN